jgi:peroxiredoxin
LADYAALYPSFEAADTGLVALSVDPPERSAAVRRELSIPFPILCDVRRAVISSWGVLNANEKSGIAVPSVFVIDRTLRLRMLAIEKVHQRVNPAAVLQFVQAMPGADGAAPPPLRTVKPGRLFLRAVANAFRRGVLVKR